MKITTYAVYDMATGELLEEESYEYEGEVALAGGGGGGSNTQTTVQKADPWSGLQPHLSALYSKAGSEVNDPVRYYPNSTYAGLNSTQTGAMNAQSNYAHRVMQPRNNAIWGSTNNLLNASDIRNNPAIQSQMRMLDQQASQQLNESIMPSIRQSSIGAGQMGSSRQGIAEGIAARDANSALINAKANLMADAYGKGLDAQTKAIGLAPSVVQAGMTPYQTDLARGQALQSDYQNKINDAVNRWNHNEQEEMNRLSWYNSILNGGMNLSGMTSTSDGMGGGGSPIAGAIGGGMAGYGLASSVAALNPYTMPIALGGAILGGLFS